jgi:hypothetical protein
MYNDHFEELFAQESAMSTTSPIVACFDPFLLCFRSSDEARSKHI